MLKIPIRTHALIDYGTGLLLLMSPWVMAYPDNVLKSIAITFGAVVLLYSSVTDYPLGLLRFVPFGIHRAADLLAGVGLLFAPIHFAAYGPPTLLFGATGGALIVLALLTRAPKAF